MKLPGRLLWLLVAGGLLLGLALAFHAFFVDLVIEPIALFLWAVWRVVASVNQGLYWTLLIIVCLFFAVRLLPPEDPHPIVSTEKYHYRHPTRLAYWQELVTHELPGGMEKEALQEAIKRLLVSAIAQTERSLPEDTAELLRSGKLDLPPAARKLLSDEGKSKTVSRLQDLRHWVRNWLGRSEREEQAAMSEILSWMESRLEIHHD